MPPLNKKCYHDAMVRTQVQLVEEQVAALRRISAETGRSMADLVREGVKLCLEAHKRPSRRSWCDGR